MPTELLLAPPDFQTFRRPCTVHYSKFFNNNFFIKGKDGSSLEDRLNMWRGRWDKSKIGWHKSVVNEHLTQYYDYLLVCLFVLSFLQCSVDRQWGRRRKSSIYLEVCNKVLEALTISSNKALGSPPTLLRYLGGLPSVSSLTVHTAMHVSYALFFFH